MKLYMCTCFFLAKGMKNNFFFSNTLFQKCQQIYLSVLVNEKRKKRTCLKIDLTKLGD